MELAGAASSGDHSLSIRQVLDLISWNLSWKSLIALSASKSLQEKISILT